MSLASPNGPGKVMATAAPEPDSDPGPRFRWYHKLIGLLFVILCFEMGVFLLVFPWSPYWDGNYFVWMLPEWRELWISPSLRGAVSGVGLVNLYVSLLEVFRLRRFSQESQ
jgi:hypothetical protein